MKSFRHVGFSATQGWTLLSPALRLEAVDEISGCGDWNMLSSLGCLWPSRWNYVLQVYGYLYTDIHVAASTVNDTSTAHIFRMTVTQLSLWLFSLVPANLFEISFELPPVDKRSALCSFVNTQTTSPVHDRSTSCFSLHFEDAVFQRRNAVLFKVQKQKTITTPKTKPQINWAPGTEQLYQHTSWLTTLT